MLFCTGLNKQPCKVLVVNSILSKLLQTTLMQQKYYIFGTLVMFVALYFILFSLYLSQDVLGYYANTKTTILPYKTVVLPPDSTPEKSLADAGVDPESYRVVHMKNFENLCFTNSYNTNKTLPKNFTLFCVDTPKNQTLQLQHNKKNITKKLTNIQLKRHKDWVFTIEPTKELTRGDTLWLLTPTHRYKLKVVFSSSRKTKLLYKGVATAESALYRYLIDLEQKLFLPFVAYSKYVATKDTAISVEAKMYAKMLHALFGVAFAKKRPKVLLNQEGFDFFSSFSKISIFLKPVERSFSKRFIVLDSYPVALKNNSFKVYSKQIVASSAAYKNLHYDKTLVFCTTDEAAQLLGGKHLEQKEYVAYAKNLYFAITATLVVVTVLLFLLVVMLSESFMARNYNFYKEKFDFLLFYAQSTPILTIILAIIMFVALLLSFGGVVMLLATINEIFYLYYLDAIPCNIAYGYVMLFFGASVGVAYFKERKYQKKILQKKGS